MKYFFDTEFIEGFKKPFGWLPTIGSFNRPRHSIQLISIGIKAEDGRTYYAVSNEFNPEDANEWVKENVLTKLPAQFEFIGFNIENQPIYGEDQWKSNKIIAQEIFEFVNPGLGWPVSSYSNSDLKPGRPLAANFDLHNVIAVDNYFYAQPEFYAYFADYDWVLFCTLFGTMMDLPKGFPQYCRDLKQTLDEKVSLKTCKELGIYMVENVPVIEGILSFDEKLKLVKSFNSYPKQLNEHNALDDAKWNFELYKFLQTL